MDGDDCAGIEFDALRPDEVGRRARLGVLSFAFCSEECGERDGGFECVEFNEALLLEGRVEDIFLSLGVVEQAIFKGLLNGSENETLADKETYSVSLCASSISSSPSSLYIHSLV